LKVLSESANASIAIRVHFLDEEGQRIPVSLKAKIIRDEEKELLGYLLTAVQVKNDLHLTKKYRITQREIEIIRGILEGKTNKEIGLELDITERTVKSHITNIFNKLVIDNRVQLIILLQEYDILPEQQADRISISAY
jgi:DNA-binding NarL/FixJ family response regulator